MTCDTENDLPKILLINTFLDSGRWFSFQSRMSSQQFAAAALIAEDMELSIETQTSEQDIVRKAIKLDSYKANIWRILKMDQNVWTRIKTTWYHAIAARHIEDR